MITSIIAPTIAPIALGARSHAVTGGAGCHRCRCWLVPRLLVGSRSPVASPTPVAAPPPILERGPMILPITHEDMRSRRWPMVTMLLIVTNIAVLLYVIFATNAQRKKIESDVGDATTYFVAHPYLSPRPPLESLEGPAPEL